MAIWPGTMASVSAYRDDIRRERHLLPRLMAMSVGGGLIGAIILIHTPQETFDRILPWLLLVATSIFAGGNRISAWLRRRSETAHGEPARISFASCGVQFLIAIYAGYFGGGASMLMLAMLSVAGMTDIHAMNGVKTLLSGTQNLVALAVFITRGIIFWPQALVMMVGAIAGGYGGAHFARKSDPKLVRRIVIGVGLVMTAYFFYRSWAAKSARRSSAGPPPERSMSLDSATPPPGTAPDIPLLPALVAMAHRPLARRDRRGPALAVADCPGRRHGPGIRPALRPRRLRLARLRGRSLV